MGTLRVLNHSELRVLRVQRHSFITLIMLTGFLLFPGILKAQVEIGLKSGKVMTGMIVANNPTTLVLKIYSKQRDQYAEIPITKADVATVHDIAADKDITAETLGTVKPDLREGEQTPRGVHMNTDRNVPAENPPTMQGSSSSTPPVRPTQQRQAGYHSELGGGLSLTRNTVVTDPDTRISPNFAYAYYFVPRKHDENTNTEAARDVIPGSEIHASLELGPFYEDAASQYALRMYGGGLISPRIGIGAAVLYHSTMWDQSSTTSYSVTDWGIGPMISIYAGPQVRLVEMVAIGSLSEKYKNSWQTINASVNTYRFEHFLSYAGRSVGYQHALRIRSVEDSYVAFDFDHFFEFPLSPAFALGIQADLSGLKPDHEDFYYGVQTGPAFVINDAALRIAISASYYVDLENARSRELRLAVSIQARL